MTTTSTAPAQAIIPEPGLKAERRLIVAIALGAMLAPLNSTMLAVALPRIAAEFQSSSVVWLVSGYLIGMAVLQPLAGKLGDWFGRRALILGGLVVFGLASLAATFSTGLFALIGLRVVQALGGALVVPNSVALLREVVPETRRATRSGLISAAIGVAATAGPPMGGLLTDIAGWQAIFSANLLLVLPAFLLGAVTIPRRTHEPRRDDAADSQASPINGRPFPQQIGGRTFAAAIAATALSNLAMYVTLLALPLWLAFNTTWNNTQTGLLLSALPAGSMLAAPCGGWLADRYGRRWPTAVGLSLFALGLLPLLGLAWSEQLNCVFAGALCLSLGMSGTGLGLSTAGLQISAIESVPRHQVGAASGVLATSRYLGSIVGSSLLGTLLVSTQPREELLLITQLAAGAACAAAVASLGLHDWPSRRERQ
jgi:MFS family permease